MGGADPNFITKNNIRYYKGIEIHDLINKLNNNEVDIPPGFERKLGCWCEIQIAICKCNTGKEAYDLESEI